jgi:hypothetical protein
LPDEYIVVGARGDNAAGHAASIDSIVKVNRDGTTEVEKYAPKSRTPGQEVLQHVDSRYADAQAIITGELKGSPNYNKRAIINDSRSISDIAERYKNGDYDSEIKDYTTNVAQDDEPGVPKRDGSGGGGRGNKGRGGCPEEEQEGTGRGSGTQGGRAVEEDDMYSPESADSDAEDPEPVGAGSEK